MHVQRTPSETVLNDALRAQASQAESAAAQLLDFDEDVGGRDDGGALPVTPARPVPGGLGAHAYGAELLQTPVNPKTPARAIWEDSPRNQAVTPTILEKIKERRYDRAWWDRQKQRESGWYAHRRG
jgi:CLIP-associating protein 1/2